MQLPGGKTCRVLVVKESQTSQVYEVRLVYTSVSVYLPLLQAVLKELGLSENSKPYFALFKVNKDGFSKFYGIWSCVDSIVKTYKTFNIVFSTHMIVYSVVLVLFVLILYS